MKVQKCPYVAELFVAILCVALLFPTLSAASRYMDNGDGTVTDTQTKLIWQKTLDETGRAWDVASQYCENLELGGSSDWRLPRVDELHTITNYALLPAIDPVFVGAGSCWSATTLAADPTCPWYVNFDRGGIMFDNLDSQVFTRCVRGGPYWDLDPATHLVIRNEDTVEDTLTSLLWQRTVDGVERTWGEALEYCDDLVLDSKDDWRLPSIKELHTIMDYTTFDPAINTEAFNGQPSWHWYHWSSTARTAEDDGTYVWFGAFLNGAIYDYSKRWQMNVRCVRGSRYLPSIPIIGQAPLAGPPGTTFSQWGDGFTPNNTAILHFRKPDGTEYPPQLQKIDSYGEFHIRYTTPLDKPPGIYTWWAFDVTDITGLKTDELSYEITSLCDPPDHVYADNSMAYGIFEGIIDHTVFSEVTTANIDIKPTEIVPFPFMDKGVQFWVSIDEIDFDPDSITTITANPDDTVGATLADLRLIAPSTHASFSVGFCRSGTATFKLGLNKTAIILTVADAIISIIPRVADVNPSQVIAFADSLNSIPLVASSINHIDNAINYALNGQKKEALSELVKAKKDEIELYFNKQQRQELFEAYKKLGFSITAGKLFKKLRNAPLRVFEIFADVIVLGIQTDWGTSGLPQIKVDAY